MFGSSLPPVIYVIWVCLRMVVSNTYCVATFCFFLRLVFCVGQCSAYIVLCCWYCLYSSCVPNVASFSRLSILRCPYGCSIFRFLCSALYISVSSCVIYLLAIVLTFDLRLLIAPIWYVHTVHILKSSSFYFIQNTCNNEKIQCYITRVL